MRHGVSFMRRDIKYEIKTSVLRLMEQKPYLDITVTDIITKAGVARASFYRSYGSINDVVDDIVLDISNKLNGKVLPAFHKKDERAIKGIIKNVLEMVKNHDVSLIKMSDSNRGIIFNKLFGLYNFDLKQKGKPLKNKYGPYSNIAIILSSIFLWVKFEYQESTDEMADYICSRIQY